MPFLFAMASAMQLVTPEAAANWISIDDHPSSALRNKEFGHVGYSVLVGPDGKPIKCDVTAPSAYDDLNAFSCTLLMRRARFKPAVGPDGQPAFGVYRSRISWLVANDPAAMQRLLKVYPRPSDIDLTLVVKAAHIPAPINLIISVDAAGEISQCDAIEPSALPSAVQVACQQVKTQWKPSRMTTSSGEAIATVQNVKVDFEMQPPT